MVLESGLRSKDPPLSWPEKQRNPWVLVFVDSEPGSEGEVPNCLRQEFTAATPPLKPVAKDPHRAGFGDPPAELG
jgi:hypothetical protein